MDGIRNIWVFGIRIVMANCVFTNTRILNYSPCRLGRITEMRKGQSGHSIAVKCQFHHDCSVLKTAKAFEAGKEEYYTDRIMAWLYEGRSRVPDMTNGFQHKQLFGVVGRHWR